MLRILTLSFLAAVTTSYAYQAGQKWPPGLQTVPNESPVLTPDASMKTIVLPPGYRLELVASEPMIAEPVWIDWDADGRLWVVEMPGYMEDMPATTELQPTGRVSVLEDADNDGRMDRKTVFLDKLVLPRTIKVLDRGVLVAEPPRLWFARDTNGDLVADSKEEVTDTYGSAAANVEHNANSLLWGLDNWMHTSEVDTFLRLKNGKFEVRKTLSRGQWGATQDDAGRVYRNTNQAALFVDHVPTFYYARNPNLLRTRGSYETLDPGDLNTTWPIRPTRGVNRGYQDGVLRPDGTLAAFTSVSAPTVYRGDRLPSELYGNVFVVEPAGNLVSRITVTVSADGKTIQGRKAYEGGEFIASTDERFRPVNLSSAPDGTLYVVDMYHGIIQHKGYITEYLREQILSRGLEKPQGHGRIYRVVHETTKRDRTPALSKAPAAQLVETLAHPNGWWRDTAQRLLVERGDRSVVPLLKQRAEDAPDWKTRLHALWTLDGIDAVEASTVIRALEDSSREVRMSAVRLAERWLSEPNHPVHAALLKRMDDGDWGVRRQLAATLGELPPSSATRITASAALLERYGDDPITVDASVSGLRGSEHLVLQALLERKSSTPQVTAAITTLAATIVRGGGEASVAHVLERAADTGITEWQRNALLEGAEAALLNEPLPGSGRRGGGRGAAATAKPAADPNAPGQRGGPGGAPAFPATQRGAGPGAGRGRGTALAAVPVPREPSRLLALTKSGDESAERAAVLLARLTWPGKPGAAAGAPPLAPADQKRYDDGRTIYTNLCIACHQEDGRGREKLAPSLVGSPFALAGPGVPIRILLHGKEGTVGLMPPLGAALTDPQIAAALTYIRRSWGHQASAVDEAAVAAVRKEAAGRARPWTETELKQLLAGQ
jgi:mono/diheme cytochrome c family protein/glucose/arabinose dehydrogenase